MTLPKATPREPAPITPGGAFTPSSGHRVIPIRGSTPAVPVPAILARTGRPTAPSVPVARRPWRVLLVPPTPGARTRAFAVARWQARLLLGALVMLLLVAAGAISAVVVALDGPDPLAMSAELGALRDRLAAVEDSLALARAVLDDSARVVASAEAAPGAATRRVARAAPRRPLLARVRTPLTAPLGMGGLPVIGAIVSGFSNARRHPILHVLRPHLGIDIAAVRGTRVAAPAAGRVTFVGRRFALGLTVDIEHAAGITTRYAHLRAALVREGQQVAAGTAIATVGSSGLATGPHLHYEVAVDGRQVDPLRFRLPQLGDSAAGLVHSAPPPAAVGTRDEPATPGAGAVPR